MKSKKWLAVLLAMMMMTGLTAAHAVTTPTDACEHPSFHWVSTGPETHTEECDVCGWQSFANGLHYHVCTQADTDTACALCGAEFIGDRTRHILEEGQKYEYEYDDEIHWEICPICHEATGEGDVHANANGDESGICAVCGAAYGDAAAEPTAQPTAAPTAEPTAELTAEPTAAPTKKPSTSAGSAVYATAAPTQALDETDDESFLSRFQGLSTLASDGSVVLGEASEVVTLVIEADGEQGYEGSELVLYPADAREDGVIVNLTSRFEAENLSGFAAWQESVTSAEALEATEAYGSFVELARALVQALFPEKADGEVDECLVALLQSGFDGTLESAELANLDEDVDGEVVGYLAAEDYEIYLVLREDSVELLVRDAE